MIDITDRLSFDATRCKVQFSNGVASNIEEGIAEIKHLRTLLGRAKEKLAVYYKQTNGELATMEQRAKTLRENTKRLRFFRGETYDGGADEYLLQLHSFLDDFLAGPAFITHQAQEGK